MQRSEQIQLILSNLPDKPGVYQFFNKDNILIYVGKAKSLRKRVYSYFSKEIHDSAKTHVLVKNISDIKYILTETEYDALLLENNLIKKNQPRYNVNLKDDKTYPWICIKNEPFPRIFYTRKLIKDGSQYFGPFASVRMINTLLDFIPQWFKLRNCSLNLTEDNISKGKFKVCLEYHIGNCLGPCEGLQSRRDYDESILQIKEILKGNISAVISHLKGVMQNHAEQFEFEKAQATKEKIESLENFQSKSVIVNPAIKNVDVFSIIADEQNAYINFLKVNNGAIIQAHNMEIRKKLDEPVPELLAMAIAEIREKFHSNAVEILVPELPAMELPDVNFVVPKIGDKKHLLDLSFKNTHYFRKEKTEQAEKLDPGIKTDRILKQMQKDLHLKELPTHIECFDNSNFQGAFPVAAMSVFKDAKPSKKDYRHFNIKTVEGPNDFASMEEVIYRRYKRMLDEQQPLPQLVVIDGGKGQLSSAIKSLAELNLLDGIQVIGIAKKLEEIYRPGDSVPLYLDKKGETLKIIQQLRDEVHRFGITHHRNRRSKALTQSELHDIKGIGESTADTVLKIFKSVKKVKEATLEELQTAAGNAKGKVIFEYFKKD